MQAPTRTETGQATKMEDAFDLDAFLGVPSQPVASEVSAFDVSRTVEFVDNLYLSCLAGSFSMISCRSSAPDVCSANPTVSDLLHKWTHVPVDHLTYCLSTYQAVY